MNQEQSKFYRFRVLQGNFSEEGKLEKTKTVGMAYTQEGQSMFTIRLWTLVSERFYLLMNREDSSRYLILTREPNKNQNAKNKYYWNIVGNGKADSTLGVIKLEFDLFEKPIYMNIFPESTALSSAIPMPESFDSVA